MNLRALSTILSEIYSVLSLIAAISAWSGDGDLAGVAIMMILGAGLLGLSVFTSWGTERRLIVTAIGLIVLMGAAYWAGIVEDNSQWLHHTIRFLVSAGILAMVYQGERSSRIKA